MGSPTIRSSVSSAQLLSSGVPQSQFLGMLCVVTARFNLAVVNKCDTFRYTALYSEELEW